MAENVLLPAELLAASDPDELSEAGMLMRSLPPRTSACASLRALSESGACAHAGSRSRTLSCTGGALPRAPAST